MLSGLSELTISCWAGQNSQRREPVVSHHRLLLVMSEGVKSANDGGQQRDAKSWPVPLQVLYNNLGQCLNLQLDEMYTSRWDSKINC